MSILLGNGGVKNVKEIYVGVDGKPRKVKEGYVGVDGVPRKFYTSSKTLSQYEIGSLVYLNESGVPVPYIVSAHEYDITLVLTETAPRSVLVRKECLISPVNIATIPSTINELENALDPAVIAAARVPYPVPGGGTAYKTAFLPSLGMLGLDMPGYDGTARDAQLPNADTLKKRGQWLYDQRIILSSATKQTVYQAKTNSSGTPSETSSSNVFIWLYPVLFLPGETPFDPATNEFAG